jgi:hypothetical protein
MLVGLKKQCSLSVSAGMPERCLGTRCVFWQPGGEDLEDGCAVERLELERGDIDVADFLLGLRHYIRA